MVLLVNRFGNESVITVHDIYCKLCHRYKKGIMYLTLKVLVTTIDALQHF